MTPEQDDYITALVEEYGKRLIELAYRYTGDAELAKDIFQTAMLTACRKIEIVQAHENVGGWLYKTVGNLACREMKKAHHRETSLEPETVEGLSGIELPLDFSLPDGLRPPEREILLLRVEQELSYGQIAEIKGLKESACRQQMSRAVRKCRQLMLRERAGEEGAGKKVFSLSQKAPPKGL